MWPYQDRTLNPSVVLITTPMVPMCSLPRFQNQNLSSYPSSNRRAVDHNVTKTPGQYSASRSSLSRNRVQLNESEKAFPSISRNDLIEAFKKFEVCITDKVKDLVERNRKMERRVITTIGLNIEAANAKYIENKQILTDFKTDLEDEFKRFESEQEKLLSIMESGMTEIKWALGEINSSNTNDDTRIDPTIMQLTPKFDDTFKNYPIGFLKQFETFVKTTRITPALQRLLFIYAAQLDNPIWRENVANIDTYEGLKKPFLNLTWSKKQQTRVYLEFERASFKDLSAEQINAEVKKWCAIVQSMENVDFRNFRISLMEKLPRQWQTTLRVFAINDFESLLRRIDLCLENESVIPSYEYSTSKNRTGFNQNRSEHEKRSP